VTFQASAVLPPFEGDPPQVPAGNRAVISTWVKPLADMQYEGTAHYGPHRPNLWLMMTRSDRLLPQPLTQALLLGMEGDTWQILMERRYGERSSDFGGGEQKSEVKMLPTTESRVPGMRWNLVTVAFDTNETEVGNGTWIRVGATPRTTAPSSAMWLPGPAVDPPEDFRDGGEITLGPRGGLDWRASVCSPPVTRCVLDEVCIQDFGDDPILAQDRADRFHAQRLQEGRYYKGDDGTFVSAVLEPDGGGPARLLRAVWTAYVPSENRREFHSHREIRGSRGREKDRQLDPALARSRVEFDLMDDASPAVLRPLLRGAPLGISRARFRYRARFINGLGELGLDPLNQPVMESPWVDDVTFFVQPATGARALSWRE
jgi:hypothetical protein